MSSLIVPAPSCKLLPALLLSVWVCLCMRHSLLNSEQYRYSEWTFEGMTQACTFDCTSLYKHRRWFGVSKQPDHMVMWRTGRLWRKYINSKSYDGHIQRHVTAGALTLSVKTQCTFILRSYYWFPALSNFFLLVSMVIISVREKRLKWF